MTLSLHQGTEWSKTFSELRRKKKKNHYNKHFEMYLMILQRTFTFLLSGHVKYLSNCKKETESFKTF